MSRSVSFGERLPSQRHRLIVRLKLTQGHKFNDPWLEEAEYESYRIEADGAHAMMKRTVKDTLSLIRGVHAICVLSKPTLTLYWSADRYANE